jgi:hypothetical protein
MKARHVLQHPTTYGQKSYKRSQSFAFSVLLAGLAALYYWYYCLGSVPRSQAPHLFAVVDIPGKGKGLVAERDIKVRFTCQLVL